MTNSTTTAAADTTDAITSISATLPDGDVVQAWTTYTPNLFPPSTELLLQLTHPDGSTTSPQVLGTADEHAFVTPTQIVTFADSTFDVVEFSGSIGGAGMNVIRFAADGTELSSTNVLGAYNGAPASLYFADYEVTGLPNDGFVVSWLGGSASAGDQTYDLQAYDSAGKPVSPVVDLGPTPSGATTPAQITANPDSSFTATYTTADGQHTASFPAGDSAAPGLTAATPIALSGLAGVTSAAVLTSGDIAVASGPDASGADHVQIYDPSGNLLSTTTLQEFAGASPTVTALAGGFFETTYANTADYEIYNSNGQLVFDHNAWTSKDLAFTPLADGSITPNDYIVSNAAAGLFGLGDQHGNVTWLPMPADAPAGDAASFHALDFDGFAITYAGSSHFDLYNMQGQQTAQGDLGASVSTFATAFAAGVNITDFTAAWLSADGGQDGLPTSLDVQTLNSNVGQPYTGVITVAQDLDPWHTQIALQTHVDGSTAVLWSEGGAVWASEISLGDGGAASAPVATGVTGSLSDVVTVQLPNDEVGFAFLQNGQVWADIVNPASGAKQLVDLGAATGDISTVHALATDSGGLAVSWHDGSTVMASVVAPSGQASAPVAIASDFAGVDPSGHAVTVADNASGVPTLQDYLNNGGSFWHA